MMRVVKKKAKKTPVKEAVKKAVKRSVKRSVKKDAKGAAKGAANKAVTTRGTTAARIEGVRIAKDGSRWTLLLASGARVSVAAAPAQSAGVRIGGRWTQALAARIARASEEQRLLTRAMGLLAKGFAGDRAALCAALGGDAAATRAVRSLRETGWIR